MPLPTHILVSLVSDVGIAHAVQCESHQFSLPHQAPTGRGTRSKGTRYLLWRYPGLWFEAPHGSVLVLVSKATKDIRVHNI